MADVKELMREENERIDHHISRVLSLLDRDFFSETLGCFDKIYWHYKRTTFLNGMMQCYLYNLAQFADFINETQKSHISNTSPKEPIFQRDLNNNEILIDACINAIDFTLRSVHTDGSLDEHYNNEKSFVATTFVGIAILKTLTIIETLRPSFRISASNEKSLKQLIIWISQNEEIVTISNHVAGSILLLLLGFTRFNEQKFLLAALTKLKLLFSFQDSEGWFKEYDGLDLGYLTLTLSYLVQIYEEIKIISEIINKIHENTEIQENSVLIQSSLKNLINFFRKIYTPEIDKMRYLWSRKNNHFFIEGFIRIKKHPELLNEEQFSMVSQLITKFQPNDQYFQREHINDDFFSFFEINDTIFQIIEQLQNPTKNASNDVKIPEIHSINLPNAGILIEKMNNSILVINWKNRNSLYLFSNLNKNIVPDMDVFDTGIILQTKSKIKYNSYLIHAKSSHLETNGNNIQIIQEGFFTQNQKKQLTTGKSIILSILGASLLKIKSCNTWIKGYLLKSTVQNPKSSVFQIKRTICIERNNFISIQDEIQMPESNLKNIEFIGRSKGLNPFFVPSGEFFTLYQYEKPIELKWNNENVAKIEKSVVLTFSQKISIK